MSVQHRFAASCVTDGASSLAGNATEIGSSEVSIDTSIAASQTDSSLSVAFTGNNVQSVFLVSDQNLTIEVNSGSAPDKTINLKANRPYEWRTSDGYFTNPFASITSATWYITTTTAARLRGKILVS